MPVVARAHYFELKRFIITTKITAPNEPVRDLKSLSLLAPADWKLVGRRPRLERREFVSEQGPYIEHGRDTRHAPMHSEPGVLAKNRCRRASRPPATPCGNINLVQRVASA